MNNRPPINLTPVVAATVVMALTFTSIGVLIAARHVVRTTSAAASGARVTTPSPGATPVNIQLSTPTTNVVWVLANYDHLYRSTDEGARWEARPLPPHLGVRPSISFIDDHEGWLLAGGSPTTQCQDAPAAVWHTKDGGSTWQQLPVAGLGTAQCKDVIYFSESGHGFVSAWDPNRRPTVYWSTDAGVGWKAATLPDPPDFKTLPGGFALRVEWIKAFGSTFYLEAYGTQGAGTPYPDIHDRQYIFTSTSGGGTWAWKQKVGSRDLTIVTESRWLSVDPPNRMDQTVDGGHGFSPFDADLSGDISAGNAQLVFADSTVGYATAGASLQRTMDGGSHWVLISIPGGPVVQPSPTPHQVILPTMAQVSAPSSTVVWVLIDGYLFRSSDQGATWQQRNWVPHQGGGGNPVISFVDDTNGWALLPGVPSTQCQEAGAQLWRTSDGAATWHLVTSVTDQTRDPKGLPLDQCKEYMAFVDSSNGFVAGHDTSHTPIISRTQDGGITWAPSTLPDPPGFKTQAGHAFSVMVIKNFAGDLLAGAQSGDGAEYVFRSTDGGASWSYLATTGANPYVPIAFVTEARWLVIFNNGAGQETTDAGNSWHTFASDYQDAAGVASTFVFADSLVGYGTVRGGLQKTVDGGARWVSLKTPGM